MSDDDNLRQLAIRHWHSKTKCKSCRFNLRDHGFLWFDGTEFRGQLWSFGQWAASEVAHLVDLIYAINHGEAFIVPASDYTEDIRELITTDVFAMLYQRWCKENGRVMPYYPDNYTFNGANRASSR